MNEKMTTATSNKSSTISLKLQNLGNQNTSSNSSNNNNNGDLLINGSGRVRNPSYSASSTMSSASSVSAGSSSHNHHNHNSSSNLSPNTNNADTVSIVSSETSSFNEVVIIFPSGYKTVKRIESRKAIYDVLIELSATAKLIPTNYTLKLYSQDETNTNDNTSRIIDDYDIDDKNDNNNNNNNNHSCNKIIDYTPNQTIGQLNPSLIKIVAKTATLKHNQHLSTANSSYLAENNNHYFSSSSSSYNNNNSDNINDHIHRQSHHNLVENHQFINSRQENNYSTNYHHNHHHHHINNSQHLYNNSHHQLVQNTPFELTIRVEVNLPFNQKTAVRVKPDILLCDLFGHICKEANLDQNKYEFLILKNNNSMFISSMQHQRLSIFDTKEVTLVLKKNIHPSANTNNLNSRSTHSLFQQNVIKSRAQTKNYISSNNKNKNQTESSKQILKDSRSKSELDLTNISSENQRKNSEAINKSDFDKSSTLNKKSSTSSTMFGFFSRKKNSETSKSRGNISSEQEPKQIKNFKYEDTKSAKSELDLTDYNHMFSKTKTKRPAPPPPPALSTETNLTRPKSQIIEPDLVLDEKSIEKLLMLTKKKKKAAPPPPPPAPPPPPPAEPPVVPAHPNHVQSEDSNTTGLLKVTTKDTTYSSSPIATSNPPPSLPSSIENQTLIKGDDPKISVSISSPSSSSSPGGSFPSPSSDSSSSMSYVTTTTSSNNDQQHLTPQVNDKKYVTKIINSLIIPASEAKERAPPTPILQESVDRNNNNNQNLKREPSIQSREEEKSVNISIASANSISVPKIEKNSNQFDMIECSMSSSSLSNQSSFQSPQHSSIVVDNSSPKMDNAVTEHLNQKLSTSSITTSTTTVVTNNNDDSLVLPNGGRTCFVKSYHGAIMDLQKSFYSEDDFSDADSMRTYNSPSNTASVSSSSITRQKIALINATPQIPQETIETENQIDIKLDTRIPNVLVETKQVSIEILDTKNEKIVEENAVEIEMSTPAKSFIKRKALIEVRPTASAVVISAVNDEKEPVKKPSPPENLVLNNDEVDKSEKQPFLRSPSSPPPQFPAIAEQDLNEQHGNYTVVRSGEIIEKNGTYYSTDGTIRGYSGTVKKLASSKALNEVFLKQQELEQQHEKEYQLELQLRQQKEQENRVQLRNNNTVVQINNTNNINNTNTFKQQNRVSLGNIIVEKKLQSNTLSNKVPTTISSSNIFKMAPFKKTNDIQQRRSSAFVGTQSKLDDELSRKLEDRRQTIANQLAEKTNNLKIDTTSNKDETHSSSSSNSECIPSSSSSSSSSAMISPKSPPTVNQNRMFANVLNENKSNTLSHQQKSPSSFVMSAKFKSNSSNNNNMYSSKLVQNTKNTLTSNSLVMNNSNDVYQNRCSLLNELKSVIPVVMDSNSNIETAKPVVNKIESNPIISIQSSVPPPPPPPPIPSDLMEKKTPSSVTTAATIEKHNPAPAVAPKTFTSDAIISINKKNQLVNMRGSLMDSIKAFNAANLKKVNNKN